MARMQRAAPAAVLLAALVLSLSGCASILGRAFHHDAYPYPGLRSGFEEVTAPNRQVSERVFFALDLPFSTALDTVLLPMDLVTMPWGGGASEVTVLAALRETEYSMDLDNVTPADVVDRLARDLDSPGGVRVTWHGDPDDALPRRTYGTVLIEPMSALHAFDAVAVLCDRRLGYGISDGEILIFVLPGPLDPSSPPDSRPAPLSLHHAHSRLDGTLHFRAWVE